MSPQDIDEFIRCFQPGYSRIPEYKSAYREIIRAPPKPVKPDKQIENRPVLNKLARKYFRCAKTWERSVFESSKSYSRRWVETLKDLLAECWIIFQKKGLEGRTDPFVWVAVERKLKEAWSSRYAQKRDGEEVEYAGEDTDRYIVERAMGEIKPACSIGYDPEAEKRINSEPIKTERLDWYDMVFMKRHPNSGRTEAIMEMITAKKMSKKHDFFPKMREFFRLYIMGRHEKAA